MAKFALKFGSFEYFWLCVVGLLMGVSVSSGKRIELGILAAVMGFLFALVGKDPLTNQDRFIFGYTNLSHGLSFIPAMIGLFGISEVLRSVASVNDSKKTEISTGSFKPLQTIRRIVGNIPTFLQSVGTGTVVGALPGAGADIAAWGAYGVSEKTTRSAVPEFGKGNWKGVVAPTSANNAAVAAAWIPALVFGVPGDAVTAIVLGAFLVYDITPGDELFNSGGADFIFAIAFVTQLILIPAGIFGILLFSQFTKLPKAIVLTAVVIFSVVGAYAMNNTMVDVWVMFGFGVLGLILERQRIPLAPLILGMILGPKIEEFLRRGLIASRGNFGAAFESGIDLFFVSVLGVMLIVALIRRISNRRTDDEIRTEY